MNIFKQFLSAVGHIFKAKFFVCTSLMIGSIILSNTALAQSIHVNADDTIAGWSTVLKSSIGEKDRTILFEVSTPDGRVISIDSTSNNSGIAQTEFFGFHTKKAGEYKVEAYYPESGPSQQFSYFTVYPDATSVKKSFATVFDQSLKANGADHTTLTVEIRDDYNNPIPNHQIEIISSRAPDTIIMKDNTTDENGRVTATIQSTETGVSTFIIQDETADITLTQRPQISFFQASSFEALGGNSLLMSQLLEEDNETIEDSLDESLIETESDIAETTAIEETADPSLHGELDHFELILLPTLATDGTTVKQNENLSIRVRALDNLDRVVKSYSGTVQFSSNDPNATLPDDYEFKASDLGEKTFSLALKVVELGNAEIEVFDSIEWEKSGTLQLAVVERLQEESQPTETGINIKFPIDGSSLGQKNITISGQGPPNIGLDVFINGSNARSGDIDTDGFFSIPITLSEGQNKIFLVEKEGSERKSNTVGVIVDATAPQIDTLEVVPEGQVEIGGFYTITITSEANLEQVSVRILVQENLIESPTQPGTYEATLPAPSIPGEYPIRATLVDVLGNRAEVNTNRVLRVVDKEIATPPQVTGFSVESVNDGEVTLKWDDMTAQSEVSIDKYKIYYGSSTDVLNKSLNTPDNQRQITLKNLQNNTPYFFAISAITDEGIESSEKSETISATPKVALPQLRATPGDASINLNWDPFENTQATQYRIYYGLQSNNYGSFTDVSGIQNSLTLNDLVNGVTYFAVITPIDQAGNELSLVSNEVQSTPISTGVVTRPSAPTNQPSVIYQHTQPPRGSVGPETLWTIILCFFITQFIVIGSKILKKNP